MSEAPALRANLGAEEGGDWRTHQTQPAVAAMAALWRDLFRAPPALAWLEDVEAAAWWNDDAAAEWARKAGRTLFGGAPPVVARVHDKAFALAVAREEGALPAPFDACCVLDPAQLGDPEAALAAIGEAVARAPAEVDAFTLKPRLGSSGRGRVALRRGSLQAPALRGAFPRLAERGGAILEPWVERSADFSTQLCIQPDGSVLLLATLEQLATPSGLVRGQRGLVDSRGRLSSGSGFDEALREGALPVALAAAAQGYRGPCGVDAFGYRVRPGEEPVLRPIVELNARFTAGLVAMGQVRRALPEVRETLGLAPGELCAWFFSPAAPAGGWPKPQASVLFVPIALPGLDAEPGLAVAHDAASLDAWLAGSFQE